MAQVTTPPPSSHSKHRRVRSTPDHASPGSSGDETYSVSPAAPSTPFSPLESRGGVTIPSTPLSPPSDGVVDRGERCHGRSIEETKCSFKPASVAELYDDQIFLRNPDEKSAPDPIVVKSGSMAPFQKSTFVPTSMRRRGQTILHPHLMASRSDPADMYAMLENQRPQPYDGHFMQVHPEETVISISSRPGSSSREEESAAFEEYVRAGHSDKINAGNAQAKLTPEACLFVANLRKDKTDRELHAALIDEFETYGTCYVKVKRNGDMPIAFVQFHEKSNADSAMERATGASILERPCRIERARAPRSVFVSRRDGRTPSKAEVLQLLQKVGEVDKVWEISEIERERFALAPGFGCRFTFYQDSIDAIAYYRDHRIYDVETFRAPERNCAPTFAWDSILSHPNRLSNIPRFDADIHLRNALWVGGLPSSVTKSELLRVFSNPRRVISHVDIKIRTMAADISEASYAVIHFADDQSASDAALCTYRRLRLFNGERVRIQWAFKDFVRNVGHGPTVGLKNHGGCGFGTYFGNGPIQDSSCSFGLDFGRGTHGVPLPFRAFGNHPRPAGDVASSHAGFVNGAGHFPVGNFMGQNSAQHAAVNSQVYGMYPGSIAATHTNGGHVANRATSSAPFVGYPVVNGTYPMCTRFPSRL
ncbi:rna recognition domain-containing protein [Diplodia corticola]|uniref:Rna recognition domain-containing protein n=1 Tax=Diplodia corticola TaxID=236234 RepID=A0A1J9R7G4_9PEZI|nr:rna recognition domain-containing protein [Diplodia corticola]OJD37478.1 rna recognition domain-containing protein [Diplodia corticola]